MLGSKLIKMGSQIPDQKKLNEFDNQFKYLRNLTHRVDRTQRTDPLIRHSYNFKRKLDKLISSGYGQTVRSSVDSNSAERPKIQVIVNHDQPIPLFTMQNKSQDNKTIQMEGSPKILVNNSILSEETPTIELVRKKKYKRTRNKKKLAMTSFDF